MNPLNLRVYADDWMSYRVLVCIERHSKWTPGRYEVTFCANAWIGTRTAVMDDFGTLVEVKQ